MQGNNYELLVKRIKKKKIPKITFSASRTDSHFWQAWIYVGVKRLVFHLSPQDGHVIIVSGCLILTAVNIIVHIRMAYVTERLVKLCKIYCDIWHWLTWIGVRVGGQTGVRYVITKFSRMDSLPDFVTHGAPLRAFRVGESSAKI